MVSQGFRDGLREWVAVYGQRAACWQAMFLGSRHDKPARLPHFPVQETDGIAFVVVRPEGVRTDHFSKIARPVGEGADLGAHFVDLDRHAEPDGLPSGFRPGHAAADDVKCLYHGVALGQWGGFGKRHQPTISRGRHGADYRRCGYRNL